MKKKETTPDAKTTATFLAAFPNCAGAIDFHGDDGARIKLDIPETEKPNIAALPYYFLNKVLRVTITIEGK